MKYIIDRIEGNFAVCEIKDTCLMIDIPIGLVEGKFSEGTILEKNKETGKYLVCENDCVVSQRNVQNRFNNLIKKN